MNRLHTNKEIYKLYKIKVLKKMRKIKTKNNGICGLKYVSKRFLKKRGILKYSIL